MMSASMFGQTSETTSETTDYANLSDSACKLIPGCAQMRGLLAQQAGDVVKEATASTVDESLAKAQEAATQVMAPTLAQLQRLERTITWAAVGCIVALALATGTVIYVAASKRH